MRTCDEHGVNLDGGGVSEYHVSKCELRQVQKLGSLGGKELSSGANSLGPSKFVESPSVLAREEMAPYKHM